MVIEVIDIYAPENGTLNVSIPTPGKEAFKDGYIKSRNTKSITVNIGPTSNPDQETNVVEWFEIDGRSATEKVELNILSDAKSMKIFCPLESSSECILNCINNTGVDKCKEAVIYIMDAIDDDFKLVS